MLYNMYTCSKTISNSRFNNIRGSRFVHSCALHTIQTIVIKVTASFLTYGKMNFPLNNNRVPRFIVTNNFTLIASKFILYINEFFFFWNSIKFFQIFKPFWKSWRLYYIGSVNTSHSVSSYLFFDNNLFNKNYIKRFFFFFTYNSP